MIHSCKHEDRKKKRMTYEYEGKNLDIEVCANCEALLMGIQKLKDDIDKLKN